MFGFGWRRSFGGRVLPRFGRDNLGTAKRDAHHIEQLAIVQHVGQMQVPFVHHLRTLIVKS